MRISSTLFVVTFDLVNDVAILPFLYSLREPILNGILCHYLIMKPES